MQISEDEFLKRLIIADASFLTTAEKLILQNNLDTSANIALSSIEDISFIIRRPLGKVSWNGKKYLEKAKTARKLISAFGIKWTSADCPDFPAMLREIPDSPYMIFYRGQLDCLKDVCVSVVGTRRATPSARRAAESFGFDAAENQNTVVSGLAFGIDVCAHRGALRSSRGHTCAVLPGGIDSVYPASHVRVAAKILETGGLVMSEYTPGTPAQKFRFVQRDRLIAALSPATVVVQSPAGSGALLTAQFALEYGRDVFFHEAAFNEESVLLDRMNEKNVSGKLTNSARKYLEDGAPVIKNYEDYCTMRLQAPGTLPYGRNKQLNLL
ncbi:MAG: DNA-protecting protein DprA [Treponema sp.]|nr:DNA-protecting protein DprA [Treponema sp.]